MGAIVRSAAAGLRLPPMPRVPLSVTSTFDSASRPTRAARAFRCGCWTCTHELHQTVHGLFVGIRAGPYAHGEAMRQIALTVPMGSAKGKFL